MSRTLPKLWHCPATRSLRPLWALEEMEIEYDLVIMGFPPRFAHQGYLELNSLGTVPYFVDGDTHMTESSGIVLYLVEKYQRYDFGLRADHPEYGDYLNWLFHSDATLTFPQTIVMRYKLMEPDERKLPQAAEDYSKWYIARLRRLNEHMLEREYLCGNKFTVADIAISFALLLGETLGLKDLYKPHIVEYLERMKARPGFKRAMSVG